jgi:diaminohydroxyphosphoribosylaminopyrimidine deaminase/5-amino-6-(5-phosphoribosylamino)uracil reductase
MTISALDDERLRDAVQLAHGAIGLSDPNPRVGCVLGLADGTVLATGHTQQAGGPHAEVMALRQASARGLSLAGATAWVSLEPCSHHGRTPPCCDALISAGLARVVVGAQDPHPLVAGRGLEKLRAAGLVVDMGTAAHREATRELNIGFFARHERGRPWVRMKVATTLDGRTALADGLSQWITGPAARTDGHAWRKRAGAVLTGIGTVLADDPRLDVRLVPSALQPLRVVVDSALRLSPQSRILAPPGEVLIATTALAESPWAALREAGATMWRSPAVAGRVDLAGLIDELGTRHINEVHLEAGATLNGAMLQAGLVDELLVYLAPTLLGQGLGLATLPALTSIPEAAFQFVEVQQLGGDLRLRLRSATGPRGSALRREH